MAGLFAGSARAFLASIIFAFETTLQPVGLLPLLAGCSSAYLVSSLMMKSTIMTEKIARRGIKVPSEYEADFLDQVLVKDCANYNVVTLNANDTLENIKVWFEKGSEESIHHGYPIIDEHKNLIGIVSRKELLKSKLSPNIQVKEILNGQLAVVYPDNTLKESLDLMAITDLNRIPVVERDNPKKITAILSRSDILKERKKYLERKNQYTRSISLDNISKIGSKIS